MDFSFGDIYLIEFDPSFGHEYQGRRPGMVVQEKDMAARSPLINVVPFTSRIANMHPFDILIEKDEKNRLTEDSIIKTYQISSFDRGRFIFKIGRAGSPTIRLVRGYLRRHFGL